MAASRSTGTGRRTRLFPSGAGGFLRLRLIELSGLGVILLGLLLAVICFSYDPLDPSFNRAARDQVNNLLGLPGAYLADVLMQSLGMAAFFLCGLFIAWGWRLIRSHAVPRWWLRLLAGLFAVLFAATTLAAVPAPASWPLRSGLGGFSGALILGHAYQASNLLPAMLAVASGALALFLGLFSLAVSLGEWRALGRGPTHLLQAAMRLLQRRNDTQTEDAPPVRASRQKKARKRTDTGGKSEKAAAEPAKPAATAPEPSESDLIAPRAPRPAQGKKAQQDAQGSLALGPGGYEAPPLSLLTEPKSNPEAQLNRDALEKNARLLEGVLQDFGVRGEIVKIRPGPVVTRYELEPAPGTKTTRVINLADDIARSMSAVSVRVAVVPGSSTIGIELPNAKRETVYLRELLAAEAFEQSKGSLPLVLGKDIGGMPQVVDLARMPHLLIAGTTGSGKSVGINAMIFSLLYRLPPERCRMIMVDPKMLELSIYDGIPHLLTPVVTEPKKAVVALKWVVREMENRYRSMSLLGVRNIDGYNARIEEARKSGQVLTRRVQTGFDPDTGQPIHEEEAFDLEPLPYIVVVVDEMADLMLVAGKEVEAAIQRLAQMARAAGIHLIMATQRPSVDVITGTIKANFPTRISFHVTSKIDSRTILGESGAEHLLGMGDMLYMAHGGRISRIHGPFVSDAEVESVVAHMKAQGQPAFVEGLTEESGDESGFPGLLGGDDGAGSGDELYARALAVVAQHRKASTSFIQRQLQIGYNRAARLIEQMEAEGVVGPANHVGRREVLLPDHGDHG
ncbi:DNA translocase FtsK [Fodinicurvata halophila]|uniref:DNA translocase FtsK n=1 Tax=Fodinicurvata halophila TaxID=1419723 RepID=A0ABV8UKQ2_9PROT